MTKSKELQTLINDLHAFRISSPTTFYHPPILDDAAQAMNKCIGEALSHLDSEISRFLEEAK